MWMFGLAASNCLMTSRVALARSSPPHHAKRRVMSPSAAEAALVEAAVLSVAEAAVLVEPPQAARDMAMPAAMTPAISCFFFIVFSSLILTLVLGSCVDSIILPRPKIQKDGQMRKFFIFCAVKANRYHLLLLCAKNDTCFTKVYQNRPVSVLSCVHFL